MIFRDALTALAQQHASRLRVTHCLTREAGQVPTGVHARRGGVGIDLVEAILQDEPRSMVCLCGPAPTAWEQRACHVAGIRPAEIRRDDGRAPALARRGARADQGGDVWLTPRSACRIRIHARNVRQVGEVFHPSK